ncbi:MotA/TolQ/ExbB proton channel family protein [Roseofilum reptotaenium CS-1145]|uniref:Biopolymer transporter ExbB n=1 Tax=Roseofilum reptotaenium AO1-A TaxID=1925591 RepID=A0A1L9QJC7_9CYAN|nr:MotA/TolQ/ExbB proton channel family protein [Roseofilum reptotaenium]MDB9516709.1 MotA/TolQ/ExbB proton channel family protein [Roseofilum reptotaenium CS-1145]OJJ13906.1 biopolymer transporter ExbB [Roseofilum reptotaenium AO1-A]
MAILNAIDSLVSFGGIVIVPLLGFSVLATTLILERLVFWWQITRRQKPLAQEVVRIYRQDVQTALMKLDQNRDLPLARIFLAPLELDQPTPEEFRLALESAGQAEIPILKRFNTLFETVITVSPLLGLLGTILGLIHAFSSLRIGDLGGMDNLGVTAGISEALISTAVGLVVAIVTLLFTNLFRGLYRRQLALIQEYGGQLELIYRKRLTH